MTEKVRVFFNVLSTGVSVDSLVEDINKLKIEAAKQGLTDLEVYPSDDEQAYHLVVYGYRNETVMEQRIREAGIKAQKMRQEKADRQKYEELKEKYG